MQCVYCGNKGAWHIIDQDGNPICDNCMAHFNTCAMCTEAQKCDFETNPINLPKQEQKTIRQGNMIMQTIVKCEARIRETCHRNCSCFDPDFGCLKENGTCAKYNEIESAFLAFNRSEEEKNNNA